MKVAALTVMMLKRAVGVMSVSVKSAFIMRFATVVMVEGIAV